MPKKSNLRVPTSDEARIIGAKGGKASGEARKRRKLLKETVLEVLQCKINTIQDKEFMEAAKQLGLDIKQDTLEDLLALRVLLNTANRGDMNSLLALQRLLGEEVETIQNIKIELAGEVDEYAD